ncbi:glycosyl transferase [Bordetella ansorpii]|uniref:Glycosyl transferase n=1 Tax=Bordetella ansorpii TaxID=288768 RepID=A0A157NDQ8_9BORD|nr:glycosyltransferase family 4 protein [Bordetella ansorpii]SAI19146.1 glycosyl transferase [Bordetella ansorpii]
MKILQLNFERDWRGGERQTMFCMRVFREEGHQVELLAREGFPLAQRAAAEGFTVHARQQPVSMGAFLAQHGRRYDIIHCQTANTLSWAVGAKWLYRRPLVVTRRTAMPITRREGATAFKWRHADLLCAVSESAADEPRRLGSHPVVVHSAVPDPQPADPARLAAFAAEHGLEGRRVIMTAASLTREKDPETLLRAVAALARRRQDFVLVHMGADGPSRPAVESLVQSQGLQPYYRYVGFQDQPEGLYPLADVFVLTSRLEGLSTSVLDAFLREVPVVSTDAGGQKESLADGRGILCPIGDHDAVAAGLDRMLGDDTLRRETARRGRDYAQREHGIREMGLRYLSLYKELLERHGKR